MKKKEKKTNNIWKTKIKILNYQEGKLEQYLLSFNYLKNQEFRNSSFVMPKIII